MSGHRFLWVVRMPSHDGESYSYDFGTDHRNDDDPLACLPDGFLERTRGRGLAVASWAPQVRVLSHPAMVAFVSHYGWNSALESVSAGMPMVAWPLYVEQKVNAVILTEVVGVALRPATATGCLDGDLNHHLKKKAAPATKLDLPDPLRLAGDVTIRVADMPDGYLDRSSPVFWQILEEVRRYRRADGFLVNSFAEMEHTIVEEFKKAAKQGAFPPVYPVGPFVRSSSDKAGGSSDDRDISEG
uniref:UDP-glycosyltransferases domain-containing protein n=1 Tax=Oryza barthii TaxID=65489 RepID=A0A0D3FLP9_9ORYZ